MCGRFFTFSLDRFSAFNLGTIILRRTNVSGSMGRVIERVRCRLIRINVGRRGRSKELALPHRIGVFGSRSNTASGLRVTELRRSLRTSFSGRFRGRIALGRLATVSSLGSFCVRVSSLFVNDLTEILGENRGGREGRGSRLTRCVLSLLGLSMGRQSDCRSTSFIRFLWALYLLTP